MVDFLAAIRRFLELNPDQVFVLFDEDYMAERDLQSAFKRAGLFQAVIEDERPKRISRRRRTTRAAHRLPAPTRARRLTRSRLMAPPSPPGNAALSPGSRSFSQGFRRVLRGLRSPVCPTRARRLGAYPIVTGAPTSRTTDREASRFQHRGAVLLRVPGLAKRKPRPPQGRQACHSSKSEPGLRPT